MSQEPAAFLLDLSSQLFRPTGWSLGFGPAPFSCAWSVPVMSVLRDAERLAGAQSWSTVWLGWGAVRLGHRAGWAGAQSWLGCWLGWGTGLVRLELLEHKAG